MYLSFDTDIIRECQNDLREPLSDRNEFLYLLIQERLKTINENDIQAYDKHLKMLERRVNETDCSIFEMSRLVRSLGRVSTTLCKAEILLFNRLEKLQ